MTGRHRGKVSSAEACSSSRTRRRFGWARWWRCSRRAVASSSDCRCLSVQACLRVQHMRAKNANHQKTSEHNSIVENYLRAVSRFSETVYVDIPPKMVYT